ncbi:hypothetical protein [Pedobacter sp. BMA]|uniref:hypothetical protein n=1 Tax=Pedobacter sp. BMA TaxID=1663685 RepID=UPI000649E2CA|nr:hypothetical protein [Pedobacter sp. BMA]KLT66467.1 hypothetical protein AB669_04550 [Pedobacter sp. BMA]
MKYKIYTSGYKYKQNENKIFSIEKQLEWLFLPKDIKVVVDLRSISTYPKYSEASSFSHPINTPKILKDNLITCYNLGDLMVAFNEAMTKLELQEEKVDRRELEYSNLLALCKQIASTHGNLCLLFPTTYNYIHRGNGRFLSNRGGFSTVMNKLFPAEEIYHFHPFLKRDIIIENTSLFALGKGEIPTYYVDKSAKEAAKKASLNFYYDDDDHNNSYSLTEQDYEDMYRDAYEGNSELTWNND